MNMIPYAYNNLPCERNSNGSDLREVYAGRPVLNSLKVNVELNRCDEQDSLTNRVSSTFSDVAYTVDRYSRTHTDNCSQRAYHELA